MVLGVAWGALLLAGCPADDANDEAATDGAAQADTVASADNAEPDNATADVAAADGPPKPPRYNRLMPLDEQYAMMKNRSPIPAEVIEIVGSEMAKVGESGIVENAIGVGDIAPDFTIMSMAGDEVQLAGALSESRVVLMFFRGGW